MPPPRKTALWPIPDHSVPEREPCGLESTPTTPERENQMAATASSNPTQRAALIPFFLEDAIRTASTLPIGISN